MALYSIILHEIVHALGFSYTLIDRYIIYSFGNANAIKCSHFRFVDEEGNRYMPTREIYGPYGRTHIFTGPKVNMSCFKFVTG